MTPKRPDRTTSCPRCGGPMSQGNGKDREPAQCLTCTKADRHAARAGHGTNARYSQGCRCTPCRAAHSAYMRDYMARRRKLAGDRGRESS